MINLSAEAEPEIHATTQRFGTVLENVVMDPQTRKLDLYDNSLAENSRGAYPLSFIPNASDTGRASQPQKHNYADSRCVCRPTTHLTSNT